MTHAEDKGEVAIRIRFRTKIMAAMIVIVAVVAGASLWLSQRLAQESYREVLESQFDEQLHLLAAKRELRLDAVRTALVDATRNPRLIAALHAADTDRFYSDLAFELESLLERATLPDAGAPPFFRFLDWEAGMSATRVDLLNTPPGLSEGALEEALLPLLAPDPGDAVARIGYMALGPQGAEHLYELVVHPIVDPFDGFPLGEIVFGAPLVIEDSPGTDDVRSGIQVGSQLLLEGVSAPIRRAVYEALSAGTPAGSRDHVSDAERGYMLFREPIVQPGGFHAAVQVTLFSLARLESLVAELRRAIATIAAAALAGGILASWWLARRLGEPISELVRGARAVGAGRLDTRVPVRGSDEIGALAGAFNEMTADLALKERFRSVLEKVTDRAVAEELTRGEIALGGEEREVTVLFCDIRGFTPLTENMPPQDVIGMLNEHMTALTGVVHRRRGVVDKFVGDEIMAVFGAPRQYGDDARQAMRSAVEMIAERRRLNEQSAWPLEIGIGLATGNVVAGCMGSTDRLNYTVLGERVNLASRLCGKAGPMEILVCPRTREQSGGEWEFAPVSDLSLKGFREAAVAWRITQPQPSFPS